MKVLRNVLKKQKNMKIINKNIAVIILAAGLGTRMKSSKAKVLHEVFGRPMIMYVVKTAIKIAGNNVILVIGHQAEKVRKIVLEENEVFFSIQGKQLGTGHAVSCALPNLPDNIEDVIILCGDVPLLTFDTVKKFLDDHLKARRDISVLGVKIDKPKGYGRILFDKNKHVCKIVEEADASEEEKFVKTINSGVYCVRKKVLFDVLNKIKSDNIQGEIYLTDIIEIGYREEKNVGSMIVADYEEFIGVNSLDDLKKIEAIMQKNKGKIS